MARSESLSLQSVICHGGFSLTAGCRRRPFVSWTVRRPPAQLPSRNHLRLPSPLLHRLRRRRRHRPAAPAAARPVRKPSWAGRASSRQDGASSLHLTRLRYPRFTTGAHGAAPVTDPPLPRDTPAFLGDGYRLPRCRRDGSVARVAGRLITDSSLPQSQPPSIATKEVPRPLKSHWTAALITGRVGRGSEMVGDPDTSPNGPARAALYYAANQTAPSADYHLRDRRTAD